MKNWLPRFTIYGATLCAKDVEYEGWTLSVEWRRFCFEISIAAIERAKRV